MKRIMIFISISVVISILGAADLGEVIAKTNATYANLNSFYTKFRQFMCDEAMGVCNIYDGEIYFLRPNFFKKTIEKPGQVLVGDSSSLWIYLPVEKRAIRQTLKDVPFAINPNLFLAGYEERFNAALTSDSAGTIGITLTPKEATEIFTRVVVTVDASSYVITAIAIVDQAGAENKFYFEDTKLNPEINRKLFKFNPPKGTEIIEE